MKATTDITQKNSDIPHPTIAVASKPKSFPAGDVFILISSWKKARIQNYFRAEGLVSPLAGCCNQLCIKQENFLQLEYVGSRLQSRHDSLTGSRCKLSSSLVLITLLWRALTTTMQVADCSVYNKRELYDNWRREPALASGHPSEDKAYDSPPLVEVS